VTATPGAAGTGLTNATWVLCLAAFGRTASIDACVQQFEGTPTAPDIGQPAPVTLISMGQCGGQLETIRTAQVRLERTGRAVRMPTNRTAVILSRRFTCSL
jgi:phage tail tape-measure protein